MGLTIKCNPANKHTPKNKNVLINEKETVLPEGFVDENIDFDYNLVIMEELYVGEN